MSLEIEKKYLCTKNNSEFLDFISSGVISIKNITQYYLPSEDNSDIRYRSVETDGKTQYFYTTKKGNGLVREEFEEEISSESFYKGISPFEDFEPIKKTRTSLSYNGNVIEIDIFKNEKFNDLILLEIEFHSLEDVSKFSHIIDFPFVIADVTEEKNYSNKNLFKKINTI